MRGQNVSVLDVQRVLGVSTCDVEALMAPLAGRVAILLDGHGTLFGRKQSHNLIDVERWRDNISTPARCVGVPLILASAMSPREGEDVARLLELQENPFLYELGHVVTPAVFRIDPYIPEIVSCEAREALCDLGKLFSDDHLPAGVFREPKRVLVSMNVSKADLYVRERLKERLLSYIAAQYLPLALSTSDATYDVGAIGLNKATAPDWFLKELGFNSRKIMAFGDSANDLPLLQIAAVGWCGCPSNADDCVKAFVLAKGGVVSEQPLLRGTLEALLTILWRNAGGNR